MYRLNKILISLCVLLCSVGAWAAPVQATEEKLSLAVNYTYDSKVIADVEVQVYLVAEKVGTKFELTQQFETLDVLFEATTTPTSWREAGKLVEQYIGSNKCNETESIRLNHIGQAKFQDLTQGVYYVDVDDVDYKDGTLVSAPVLVTVPLYCNDTNDFICDVTMEPKVVYEDEPEPTKPTPTIPTTPDDPDPTKPPETTKPDPSEPPKTTRPDPSEPPESSEPDPSEPAESTEPDPSEPAESTEPNPSETKDPDDLHEIPDGGIPLTGTLAWLIIPLAVVGTALFVFGLFGFDRKKEGEGE